ncbi:hypothetical protein SAMN04487894_12421 [Niabella drilacis]|uniref:Uncharacterized protein n=1 Tax=Niabella drilacis (strain DSM 25811 / CCM 8410 / CCUG 62505 / LMG 26954 / E90) TaxID=1285928 RepID=A0A1G7APU4_NIADE|nr:hypothetical protein SAMN04487894_12421 [Niabella drilacis]
MTGPPKISKRDKRSVVCYVRFRVRLTLYLPASPWLRAVYFIFH